MSNPFFMVFVEGQKAPAFKHVMQSSAEDEAKRLAEHTGLKAYVLATIKSYELPAKFVEEDLTPDSLKPDLPF